MIDMWIPLLERHITRGKPGSPFGCPVYHALQDAIGDIGNAANCCGVTCRGMKIVDTHYSFGSLLCNWIAKYDTGAEVEDLPEMTLKIDTHHKIITAEHASETLYPDGKGYPPIGWFLQLRQRPDGTRSFVFLSEHIEDYRAIYCFERNPYSLWLKVFDPFAWAHGEQDLDEVL